MYNKWFSYLCFRDAKEKEEKMKQLKEQALQKAKKAAKKYTKDLTKKKSTTETKEVRFHIPARDSSLYDI